MYALILAAAGCCGGEVLYYEAPAPVTYSYREEVRYYRVPARRSFRYYTVEPVPVRRLRPVKTEVRVKKKSRGRLEIKIETNGPVGEIRLGP